MHPCITTLGDRYRASLHVYERSVRVRPPAPKNRAMPVCDSGSVAGLSKCGRWGRCIVQRLCATAIVHPCTTRTVRVRPLGTKKAGLCLFVIVEVWRGVEMRSFGSLRPCSDFVRPLSCILARPAQCGFSLPPHQK